jgi:hypothetical protein
MTEIIGHKEVECPICKGELGYIGAVQAGENDVFYPVKCLKCLAEGKQWHNLTFSEIRMEGPPGKGE